MSSRIPSLVAKAAAVLGATLPLLAAGVPAGAPPEDPGRVIVRVAGIAGDGGEVACALWRDAKGFPMAAEAAHARIFEPARSSGTECIFEAVPAGRWAVSVSRDLNGNRTVDTDFLGRPKEPWAVSRGVRHRFRAPDFAEAAFDVDVGQTVSLEVVVAE